ncbi:MAG: HDOD domain-containing protein [Anaerolineaceae bacterium]|nr:HDOD domain-containing protein [Anaerolineaceae bacterium]
MTIDELIQRVGRLPPLPQAAQKALELIRNPHSNMADVARVLSMDEVMTSLVLRWANSAFFGLSNPVSTVQQAIVYLGQNTIQSLILTASVANFMDRPVPGYGLERGDLWKHAVGVAAGARIVGSRFGNQFAEEAYHAGLLCDIGKLAFEVLLRSPEVDLAAWEGHSFDELEKEYFGISHATLGAEMVRRWKLPTSLVAAITYHHNPTQAGEHVLLASTVHVADAAAMMLGIGIGTDGLQYELDEEALKLLNWNERSFEELFDKIESIVTEAENFIGMVK